MSTFFSTFVRLFIDNFQISYLFDRNFGVSTGCAAAKTLMVAIEQARSYCEFGIDRKNLYAFHDDETQKVFKLNDNLIYGVTGLIDLGETLLSPLSSISDLSAATIDDAYKAVLLDFEAKKYTMAKARNYIIGGRDLLGKFTMIQIHCNFETFKPEVQIYKPNDGEFNIVCALPVKLHDQVDKYVDMVGTAISECRTLQEMYGSVAGVIGKIADVDDTVNHNVQAVSLW